jgi:disulfide bond formation protein DsbB
MRQRYSNGLHGEQMLARTENQLQSNPVVTAAGVVAIAGTAAILGALFFQYVIGLAPCPLCLEQRIPYYVAIPLSVMLIIGASVGSSRKVLAAGLLFIAAIMIWNAYMGVYHSGVEWKWWAGPRDCSGELTNLGSAGSLLNSIQNSRVVRCDEAAWRFLGLSLAGYNALISLALAAVAGWGALQAFRGPARA